MLPLIWLLFVFPAYTLLVLLIGASIYHKGTSGQSPMPALPKWSISRKIKQPAGNGDNRFPEV